MGDWPLTGFGSISIVGPALVPGASLNNTPVIGLNAAKRARTRKAVDDIDQVRCKSGSFGIIREEVYVDERWW